MESGRPYYCLTALTIKALLIPSVNLFAAYWSLTAFCITLDFNRLYVYNLYCISPIFPLCSLVCKLNMLNSPSSFLLKYGDQNWMWYFQHG